MAEMVFSGVSDLDCPKMGKLLAHDFNAAVKENFTDFLISFSRYEDMSEGARILLLFLVQQLPDILDILAMSTVAGTAEILEQQLAYLDQLPGFKDLLNKITQTLKSSEMREFKPVFLQTIRENLDDYLNQFTGYRVHGGLFLAYQKLIADFLEKIVW